MSFWPYLHFFNTLVYLYLAVYIFIKNPKAMVNRIYTAFLLCFALWSLTLIFIHNPLVSKSTARLFVSISSFGWVGFGSLFIWFILAYTGSKKILRKKWLYLLLLGVPLLFIYMEWTNVLFAGVIKMYYG